MSIRKPERKPYPSDVTDSDVTDGEWAFVAPYLTVMTQDAPQRDYPLSAGSPKIMSVCPRHLQGCISSFLPS